MGAEAVREELAPADMPAPLSSLRRGCGAVVAAPTACILSICREISLQSDAVAMTDAGARRNQHTPSAISHALPRDQKLMTACFSILL